MLRKMCISQLMSGCWRLLGKISHTVVPAIKNLHVVALPMVCMEDADLSANTF